MGPSELKLQQKLEMGRGPACESKEPRFTKWGPLMRFLGPTESEADGGYAAAVGETDGL